MIKKLIEDLATDKTSISTALSTAKVIAKRLGVENFSNWVNYELNGYPNDVEIPDYRKMFCDIEGDVVDGWGNKSTGVILDFRAISQQVGIDFYQHEERQSIQSLEFVLANEKGAFAYVPFPQGLVRSIPVSQPGVTLLSVHKKTSISLVHNIIVQTKQRLLDLFLEIEKKYPTAADDKPLDKEQADVINNLITYNMYGSHNVAPVAVGKSVSQSLSVSLTQNNIEQTLRELSEIGVAKEEVQELKTILEDKEKTKDKPTLKKQVMSWFGKLAMKAAEKGMELELPHVLDKLNHYL